MGAITNKQAEKSLLDLLQEIPDKRSRHGRIFPLYGLLAVLILAAMQGENSLRGMWQWAKEREKELVNYYPLGLWGRPHLPSLGTFWYALQRLDAGQLEQQVSQWVEQTEKRISVDGKRLRGSKRRDEGKNALYVVTLAGHTLRSALDQIQVEGNNELGAALELLETTSLDGKIITADAGLLRTPLAQKVVEKGGPISGYSNRINQN